MNKTIMIITFIAIVLYSILLCCIGIYGENIQTQIIEYGKIILKYLLILFGYFLTIFLPIRIYKQLLLRKERQYQIESNRKIQELAEQKKHLEEKIMQEYVKSEDSI